MGGDWGACRRSSTGGDVDGRRETRGRPCSLMCFFPEEYSLSPHICSTWVPPPAILAPPQPRVDVRLSRRSMSASGGAELGRPRTSLVFGSYLGLPFLPPSTQDALPSLDPHVARPTGSLRCRTTSRRARRIRDHCLTGGRLNSTLATRSTTVRDPDHPVSQWTSPLDDATSEAEHAAGGSRAESGAVAVVPQSHSESGSGHHHPPFNERGHSGHQ